MMLLALFLFTMDQGGAIVLEQGWRSDLAAADLYRCRALAVAENGVVAAIDRDEGQVVLFHPDGVFKRRIERTGEGPGELQTPVEISWSGPHQAFAVLDFGNSRLSFWSTEGGFISETTYSGTVFQPLFPNKETVLLARNPGALNADPTLVKMDIASGELIELWRRPAKPHEWSTIAGSAIRIRFRWDPKLSFGLGKSFIAVTFGDMDQVELLNLNGASKKQNIVIKLPRPTVSERQIEEGIALLPLDVHQGLRQGLKKPDRWPLIRELFVDPEDRIWVIGSSGEVDAPHPFLVFSAMGKLLGRGEAPKVPLAITEDALYMLVEGVDHALILEKRVFRI